MQQRLPIKRSNPPNRNRLISTLLTYLPGISLVDAQRLGTRVLAAAGL